jgi:hypothetical protein
LFGVRSNNYVQYGRCMSRTNENFLTSRREVVCYENNEIRLLNAYDVPTERVRFRPFFYSYDVPTEHTYAYAKFKIA